MRNSDSRFIKHHGEPERPRQPSTISVPDHAHPAAATVYRLMRERNIRVHEICDRSGILPATLKAIRNKNCPRLSTVEALLGALDYRLVPVPSVKILPADLREDLAPLAAKHGMSLESLTAHLVESAALTAEISEEGRSRVAAERARARQARNHPPHAASPQA